MVRRPGRLGLALAAGVPFGVSLVLDLQTLLPDVGTWDTAEFQAVGPVLGIAHPTGFPTWTLLAWLASVVLQPFGSEAYRADMLSALLVSGAAALCSLAVVMLTRRPALGIAAGVALAVTPVAWRVAVRADAHALHLFLVSLLLVLLVGWMQAERGPAEASRRPGAWLVAAAVVFGLSLGNHALTLLLAPGTAVFTLLVAPAILWSRWRLLLACLAALVVTTVLVYAYIPIRSAMDPPLDYARPTTWERFRYLVLGEQFRGTFRPLPSLGAGAGIVARELERGLGLLAPLAFAGAFLGLVRHWRVVVLTGLWFALTWLFALGYENAAIERYYLVPLLVAVVWAALAVDLAWDAAVGLLREALGAGHAGTVGAARPGAQSRWLRRAAATGAAVVLLAVVLLPVEGRRASVDASGDDFGRRWLDATFAALEPDAVIVSWWSFSTTLWYGRWVEGGRPDVLIIDDRDVLDDGLGDASGAVDRYLGERPVYVIRTPAEIETMRRRYHLETVPGVPSPGTVYRVLGRLTGLAGSAV